MAETVSVKNRFKFLSASSVVQLDTTKETNIEAALCRCKANRQNKRRPKPGKIRLKTFAENNKNFASYFQATQPVK
jgi:hypothetical protein